MVIIYQIMLLTVLQVVYDSHQAYDYSIRAYRYFHEDNISKPSVW